MLIKTPDLEIAYREQGQAEPIILLHGFGLNYHIWDPIVAAFHEKARFITPDLRGHGQSEVREGTYSMDSLAADLAAFMDALGIERAMVGGHSLGGYVALAFAAANPGRLSGLALITTNARADAPDKRQGRYDTAQAVQLQGASALAGSLGPRLSKDQALVEALQLMISQTHLQGIIGASLGMAERPDRMETLKALTCPILVVAGEEDMITPLPASQEMADANPHARLLLLPGAGHMPMLEAPLGLGTALLETSLRAAEG